MIPQPAAPAQTDGGDRPMKQLAAATLGGGAVVTAVTLFPGRMVSMGYQVEGNSRVGPKGWSLETASLKQ